MDGFSTGFPEKADVSFVLQLNLSHWIEHWMETHLHVLTVQSLYAADVVLVQSEVVAVSCVHRAHERTVVLGVA